MNANELRWEDGGEIGGSVQYILYHAAPDTYCEPCEDYHPVSVGAVQQFPRGTYWWAHHWDEVHDVKMKFPTRDEAMAWLAAVVKMS